MWLFVVLSLFSSFAIADYRIQQIKQAWNDGDSLSVQNYIHGDYVRATLGYAAEQGGTTVELDELKLAVNDKVIQFYECKDKPEEYFCAWEYTDRPLAFGGAEQGQALDVATTALALGLGFTEMNPLGLAVLPLKAAGIYYANKQPYTECVNFKTWLDSVGIGAGVANIITIAAVVSNPIIPLAVMAVTTAIRYDYAKQTAEKECR